MMTKRKVFGLFILSAFFVGLIPADAMHSPDTRADTNTFVNPVYKALPLGAVKPQGWLRHQLEIMRDGSTGHLDEVYNKVKNDNGWLGGKGDGWEETPYWLDGAVPLAYLLDDKILQAKVLRYINWTLQQQRPSGYFGPLTKSEREKKIPIGVSNAADGDDWWPKMVMLKVLQQYYTATNDTRVLPFMTRYFNYQLQVLKTCPLGKWTEWATSRGSENVMIVQWLYSINKDKKLLELAALLESQSFAWSNWLGNRSWVMDAAAQQNDQHWMRRHGVNVGMGLKVPALNYQRTGNKQHLEELHTGFSDIMHLHGLPMGIFSADEDLHGNAPTQGTELCAVVESMFSLEEIIGITAYPFYFFKIHHSSQVPRFRNKPVFYILFQFGGSTTFIDEDIQLPDICIIPVGHLSCSTYNHTGKYVVILSGTMPPVLAIFRGKRFIKPCKFSPVINGLRYHRRNSGIIHICLTIRITVIQICQHREYQAFVIPELIILQYIGRRYAEKILVVTPCIYSEYNQTYI
jgi:hypothetical protein